MTDRTAELMADEDARATMAATEFPREFLAAHLADERRKASLLGEIREAIFDAQDGLVSTLAVVSTVAGASSDRFVVLIAGIASGLESSVWAIVAVVLVLAAAALAGSHTPRQPPVIALEPVDKIGRKRSLRRKAIAL